MKNIYITKQQLSFLSENEKKEITFYEFFVSVKKFLKDLLQNPNDVKLDSNLQRYASKNELLDKMTDLGIIKKTEKIDEVFSDAKQKKIARHLVQYKVPKRNFNEKVQELYKDVELMRENTRFVFADEQQLVDEIKAMDSDGAYANRGGLNEEGEGGGATSCGSVMQGGGSNPNAGQFTVPFGDVQRRGFYKDALKRNKDSKNGSISINKKE